MKPWLITLLSGAALWSAVGVTSADPGKDESGKATEKDGYSTARDRKRAGYGDDASYEEGSRHYRYDDDGKHGGHRSYFHEHGYTRLQIPPGHYPPPGECRLWYPDRPPGHQPPPGACGPAPPGAWVIHHPPRYPNHVHVRVYDPRRPGRILVTGEFEISSGTFVRTVLDQ